MTRKRPADFTAAAGNGTTLGPLTMCPDQAYDCVANLQLDGCHFQAGTFVYESGGPQYRTLKLRNTIFERSLIQIDDLWRADGDHAETLTAINNLFYHCDMWLTSVSGGNWDFIDNLFDNVSLHGPGPVNVNNHNAYVNMNSRLSPAAPTTTDPNLASLSYAAGPLGGFYLPSDGTAALLTGTGSRSAGAAGLYHFTSFTSNAKEAGGQVNIGPAYLALCNGQPCDSNGDGIPDFIADRDGDGVEDADEIPWQSPNTGGLAILSPANNSVASGVVKLAVNPGAGALAVGTVNILVDEQPFSHCLSVVKPSASYASPEFDTRFLNNGTHTISVQGTDGTTDQSTGDGADVESAPIIITIANPLSFVDWIDRAELQVIVNAQAYTANSGYTLWFFASFYPKSYTITPASSRQGTTDSSGNLSYFDFPSNLGFGDGSTDPAVYSITEMSSQAAANPNTQQSAGNYPTVGRWATAYSYNPGEYFRGNAPDSWVLDPLISTPGNGRWFHDGLLEICWRACGPEASAGEYDSVLSSQPWGNGYEGQTWPLRNLGGVGDLNTDQRTLKEYLALSFRDYVAGPGHYSTYNVYNFYGYSHGSPSGFMGIGASDYGSYIQNKRFRFAFFDGCNTAYDDGLFKAFGATEYELNRAQTFNQIYNAYYPGPGNLPIHGPIQVGVYEQRDPATNPDGLGIKPGLFLGWLATQPVGHYFRDAQTDPTTGKSCNIDHYAAMCDWQTQLMFFWREEGQDFLFAFSNANDLAASDDSDPPWDLNRLYRVRGANIKFMPQTCLSICGYANIRFNEFNHAGDPW